MENTRALHSGAWCHFVFGWRVCDGRRIAGLRFIQTDFRQGRTNLQVRLSWKRKAVLEEIWNWNVVGKHHTSWYPGHIPGSKNPISENQKVTGPEEMGSGLNHKGLYDAHTPQWRTKKEIVSYSCSRTAVILGSEPVTEPFHGDKKQLRRIFPLHKRASRTPGPHSLAALSVAMRAKSSWSKTVFWCSLILLIHWFTSRWPREEMYWESSAKSGSTNLIPLFQCCIYWLHIKGFRRATFNFSM